MTVRLYESAEKEDLHHRAHDLAAESLDHQDHPRENSPKRLTEIDQEIKEIQRRLQAAHT